MVDVKSAVYTAIKGIATNVGTSYPTDWATFPSIQITEEQNNEHVTLLDGTEASTYIRVRIDVWMDDSGSAFNTCESVNDAMKELGYTRTNQNDVQDPSGFEHVLMRFELIKD